MKDVRSTDVFNEGGVCYLFIKVLTVAVGLVLWTWMLSSQVGRV